MIMKIRTGATSKRKPGEFCAEVNADWSKRAGAIVVFRARLKADKSQQAMVQRRTTSYRSRISKSSIGNRRTPLAKVGCANRRVFPAHQTTSQFY